MQPELLAALLFVFLCGGISLAGYFFWARSGRLIQQMQAPLEEPQKVIVAQPKDRKKMLLALAQRVGEFVPASPQQATEARRLLLIAGYRSEFAIKVLAGIKLTLALLLLAGGLVFRSGPGAGNQWRNFFPIMGAAAGYVLPGAVLKRLAKARQKRIRLSLPDALDLTVVCVEAGLGLDQAIANVSRELRIAHKDICDEFNIVHLEMRAGTRRLEALRNLADRIGVDEVRKLVAVLVQADRFGTGIGDSLRTHSEHMRIRRRQEAEERANKVAVKLVFPIFFCILPAIVLVAVGPAILQIFKTLLPMMQNMGGG